MKKILLILALAIGSLSVKAQYTPLNVIYWFGMNNGGQLVIDPTAWATIIAPPTINSGVTRPINSTTYTISTTKDAEVSYNISISCTATIGGSGSGSVALQYSTNGGSTYTTAATISNSNTITLAIVLNSVQIQQVTLTGFIPANALVKMVPTVVGTTSITYVTGQERY